MSKDLKLLYLYLLKYDRKLLCSRTNDDGSMTIWLQGPEFSSKWVFELMVNNE
jgi:hypothetical protein